MGHLTEWLEPGEKIEWKFSIGPIRLFFMCIYQFLLLIIFALPLIFSVISVGIVMDEAPFLLMVLIPILFVVMLIAYKVVSHVLEPAHLSSVLGTVDATAATSVVYFTHKHIGQKAIHKHPLIAYGEIESIMPGTGMSDRVSDFIFGVRKVQLHTHFRVQSMAFYLPARDFDKIMAHIHAKMQESRKKQ